MTSNLSEASSFINFIVTNDDTINNKVLENLKSVESVHKGVVISGYPNNFIQLDFIQKSGFMPDRYFYLPSD